MAQADRTLRVVGRDALERVAAVCGGETGAARALRDYDRRQDEGEAVVILYAPGVWLVGPDPMRSTEVQREAR